MLPAVSVIVPVFNTVDFLSRCLGSIAAQTLRDFEAIVVDDGSTDASAELAEAFCAQDPRFRLLRHGTNRGLAAARNTGVRAALGTYIAQVDSDDAIAPEMLETMLAEARDGDFDMVACGMREVDVTGTVLRNVVPEAQTVRFDGPPRDAFAFVNPSVVTKLWRRSIYTEHDIWFAEGRRYEDLGWTYRAMLHCRGFRVLDRALYDYTIRPGSETHSFSWNALIEHIAAFELLRQALTEAGLVEHNIASFHTRVRASLAFHAWNVCALAPPSEERMGYLRGILAISQAYGQEDPRAFRPDDITPIIGAIERGGSEGLDATIAAQRERIRALLGEAAVLRALVNDLSATMRVPIFMLRPLAAVLVALGRLFPRTALRRRGEAMQSLRRRIVAINQTP